MPPKKDKQIVKAVIKHDNMAAVGHIKLEVQKNLRSRIIQNYFRDNLCLCLCFLPLARLQLFY